MFEKEKHEMMMEGKKGEWDERMKEVKEKNELEMKYLRQEMELRAREWREKEKLIEEKYI